MTLDQAIKNRKKELKELIKDSEEELYHNDYMM